MGFGGTTLEVLRVIGRNTRSQKICEYRCVCGSVFEALEYNIKSGHTKSCGCMKAHFVSVGISTHKESRPQTTEYRAWSGIKTRCENPSSRSFKDYGGRGILMCKKWSESYEAFLAHVGRRPTPKHSMDRIDNSKGYEPGNVRWATASEQSRNRRSTRVIEFMGRSQCLQDWSKELGINQSTLFERLQKWPLERALTKRKVAE